MKVFLNLCIVTKFCDIDFVLIDIGNGSCIVCFDLFQGDILQHPQPASSILIACGYIFGALEEFDKQELLQLTSCEREAGIALVEVVSSLCHIV